MKKVWEHRFHAFPHHYTPENTLSKIDAHQ